jgi:Uri superfamily endonuclease
MKAVSGKGIYVLHLDLVSDRQIRVGSLGIRSFHAGHYAYVGRAFGPGGLAARLRHHLRSGSAPHWHIDYLRAHGRVREIWYGRTQPAYEHLWARVLMQMDGVTVPAKGFGSSDCRCRSHLVQFDRAPCKAAFRRRLSRLLADPPPTIRRVQIALTTHRPTTKKHAAK